MNKLHLSIVVWWSTPIWGCLSSIVVVVVVVVGSEEV